MRIALRLSVVLLACLFCGAAAQTIFLVRHAERDPGKDPPLNAAGEKRAACLAQMLRDSDIRNIFVTEFQRTAQTAAPLANALKLDARQVKSNEAAALLNAIHAAKGNVLVVGHSNTIPEIVEKLGGKSQPMPDDEYDRMYVLDLTDPGKPHEVVLHYCIAEKAHSATMKP